MAEQRSDGFQAHPAVDGLGGEGVAQLVGVDMAESGDPGDTADDPADPVAVQSPAVDTSELDPETYGAALLPLVGAFVVGRNGITDEQARASVSEQQQRGERGEFYFASTQLCFTATKPQS